jgi:prepilin-type N-terminal cleavage/methylation domain-containing protein
MNMRFSDPWVRTGAGRRGRRRASGFTLFEMLVAMAVTLILIFALSQAFAIVGESVSQGRATLELAGGLRSVAAQLQEDLQGLTVPARPWADDASAPGYLQIVEGPERTRLPSTDGDWDADGTFNTDPTVTNTVFGDLDDILAFTTRNAKTPFIGQYVDSSGTAQAILSSLAEVVWWIQYDDRYVSDPDQANGAQDADEGFVIYRRVLLIRPDLNNASGHFKQWTVSDDSPATNVQANAPGYRQLRMELTNFFSTNDVSVRLRSTLSGGNLVVTATANSLTDLTRRENRFAHWPVLSDRSPSVGVNPHFSRPNIANDGTSIAVPSDAPYDSLDYGQYRAHSFDVNRRSVTSLYRLARPRMLYANPPTYTVPYASANHGQDVMISNALSFDVRVFDPSAPLRAGNAGESLVPGDPGYLGGFTSSSPPPDALHLSTSTHFIGRGAFVDLGYGIRSSFPGVCYNWSDFSDRPTSKSGLAHNTTTKAGVYEYCTWATSYERGGNANDGFDNDGLNGVDDVGERSTSPPYPVALRGIQVKIRVWDPDSRQVRQVSVVSNFIPE